MKIMRRAVEKPTTADTDILDLTDKVAALVAESDIAEGTVTVFTPGATAGVTTIEYESGCLADLRRALEILALGAASTSTTFGGATATATPTSAPPSSAPPSRFP